MHSTLPDFDVLAAMARKNPAGLEALRHRLCEELITSAPSEQQRRLRGLQFHIDAQRQLAKTPMQACVKISEMMHESFADLRIALHDLSDNQPPAALRARARRINNTKTCRIVHFRGNK